MSLSPKTKEWLGKNAGISLKGKTVVVTGSKMIIQIAILADFFML